MQIVKMETNRFPTETTVQVTAYTVLAMDASGVVGTTATTVFLYRVGLSVHRTTAKAQASHLIQNKNVLTSAPALFR